MQGTNNNPKLAYLTIALALVVLYLAYRIFAPFFVPLFWGAVLGLLFHPIYRRLSTLLGGRASLASALLTVAVLVLVLLPSLALSVQVIAEAIELFQAARQALLGKDALFGPESVLTRYGLPIVRRLGLSSQELHQAANFALQRVGGLLVELGSGIIGNLVGMVVNILLTVVALYYAFKDGPLFLARLKGLLPLPNHEVEGIMERLGEVVHASVFSTFAVAIAQGVAGGLVFLVLGLPKPLLWGVVMGAASIIPLAGPPVVWVPAAIYLAFVGDYARAAALVIAGAAIVGTLDNLLRPYLIHGRIHIHNFYLFFGILGGIYVMGFTGILLGPILVSLSLTVLRIYEERRGAPDILPPGEQGQ